MKLRNFVIITSLAVALLFTALYGWHDWTKRHVNDGAVALLQTPITFYGRVTDQFGRAVPEAIVQYETNDNPSGIGTKSVMKTDGLGFFTIDLVRGGDLSIKISKEGYYGMGNKPGKIGSSAGFSYASLGGAEPHRPNKANPVVFMVYKQGKTELLKQIAFPRMNLLSDGVPVVIHGMVSSRPIECDITVRAWSNSEEKNRDGTYDWRVEVQLVHGGILPRNDELDFDVPTIGYHSVEEISMPAALRRPVWQDVTRRLFFVRLDNGIFGCLNVNVAAPPHGSISISGLVNPHVGSNVLEPDRNQGSANWKIRK